MPRKATIGPAVYERVNELVSDGRSRTEAFAQIAQERSSRPGTIAANYYRTARSQGASSGRRRTTRARRSSAPRARASATSTRQAARAQDGDITQLANQISDLVQQLVRQVQERDQRIRELLG
jgi:flagellar biosynthesis/type III secretory pathway protein FliH